MDEKDDAPLYKLPFDVVRHIAQLVVEVPAGGQFMCVDQVQYPYDVEVAGRAALLPFKECARRALLLSTAGKLFRDAACDAVTCLEYPEKYSSEIDGPAFEARAHAFLKKFPSLRTLILPSSNTYGCFDIGDAFLRGSAERTVLFAKAEPSYENPPLVESHPGRVSARIAEVWLDVCHKGETDVTDVVSEYGSLATIGCLNVFVMCPDAATHEIVKESGLDTWSWHNVKSVQVILLFEQRYKLKKYAALKRIIPQNIPCSWFQSKPVDHEFPECSLVRRLAS